MNNEQIRDTFSSDIEKLAAVIPDTPIVSIAGQTLSKITTTTTSTSTTPTPAPFTRPEHSKASAGAVKADKPDKSTGPAPAKHTTVKPMSDAGAAGATASVSGTSGSSSGGSYAGAGGVSTSTSTGAVKKEPSLSAASVSGTASGCDVVRSRGHCRRDNKAGNPTSVKKSKSCERKSANKWDDSLKEFLDNENKLEELLKEAFSYKNPRDKENKSPMFLRLLKEAEKEKEEQPFSFHEISRLTHNSMSSSSPTSNIHQQQPNRNRHQHKQGGSLQDIADAVHNDLQLDCDFEGDTLQRQRQAQGQSLRLNNHNSRQKKYSSVSTRQREGGSLPSNVNVSNCSLGVVTFEYEDKTGACKRRMPKTVASAGAGGGAAAGAGAGTAVAAKNSPDKDVVMTDLSRPTAQSGPAEGPDSAEPSVFSDAKAMADTANGNRIDVGDFVIEIGEPMIVLHQKQQIQSGEQGTGIKDYPFYEHVDNVDMRIPRANIINSTMDFAPSGSHCFVGEGVRFTAIEGGNGSVGMLGSVANPASSAGSKSRTQLDSKYLPLDENYKSCKSIMGESADLLRTSTTLFSSTKTFPRQLDENGNALGEIYQPNAQGGQPLLHTCASGSTVTINSSGPSQAKSKSKKKSQQERNTTTFDVESVAGYRGMDPIEVLIAYIDGTEEKGSKKKSKKDKHKIKKSNSLGELRSCPKIDISELEETAATTESSVVTLRKGKTNKNNSQSTADINKNCSTAREDSAAEAALATEISSTTANNKGNSTQTAPGRKNERRSWDTEADTLHYWGSPESPTANLNFKIGYAPNINSFNDEKGKERKTKNKEKPFECTNNSASAGTIVNTNSNGNCKEPEKEQTINVNYSSNLAKFAETTKTHVDANAPAPSCKSESEDLEYVEKHKPKKHDSPASSTASSANTATSTNTTTTVCANTFLKAEATDAADMLAESHPVLFESAEFHIVTKKKKPKKHRGTLDDSHLSAANVGGLSRTNNYGSHTVKSTPGGTQHQQQQQQQPTQLSYMRSKNHNSSPIYINPSQSGDRVAEYTSPSQSTSSYSNHNYDNSSFNNTNVNSNNNNNNNSQLNHLPAQSAASQCGGTNPTYSRRQQMKPNILKGGGNSRRKSTSSVPPSEKSDSSDLDSLHSLPIECSSKSKQHSKSTTQVASMEEGSAAASNVTSPVPKSTISYAIIAASGASVELPANPNNATLPPVDNNTTSKSKSLSTQEQITAAGSGAEGGDSVQEANVHLPPVKGKQKKMYAMKTDFPELVAPVPINTATTAKPTTAATEGNSKAGSALKTISYSQSVLATPALSNNDSSETESASPPEGNNEAKPMAEGKGGKRQLSGKNDVTFYPKPPSDDGQQQQPRQPQQPLQKSKSMENQTYSISVSNMDQQYPALEHTVKRHSTANVTTTLPATKITSPVEKINFNFAAAARKLVDNSGSSVSTAAGSADTSATLGDTAMGKKSREKVNSGIVISAQPVPPAVGGISTNATNSSADASFDVGGGGEPSGKMKKQRTEKPAERMWEKRAMPETHDARRTHGSLPARNVSNSALRSSQVSNAGAGYSVNTSSAQPRPAVIILNDDHSLDLSSEFTFGDFNEDEMKLFDEDDESNGDDDECADVEGDEIVEKKCDFGTVEDDDSENFTLLELREEGKALTEYSNDSGASSDVMNVSPQKPSEELMATSSPITSQTGAVQGSHPDDSGIYTVRSTSSKLSQDGRVELNSSATANSSANRLETCNDIETAIIAAARAAAVVSEHTSDSQISAEDQRQRSLNAHFKPQQLHQKQPKYHPHHHQHSHNQYLQQQHNNNRYHSHSNSSSLSSTSSATVDAFSNSKNSAAASQPHFSHYYSSPEDECSYNTQSYRLGNKNNRLQQQHQQQHRFQEDEGVCSNPTEPSEGPAPVCVFERKDNNLHFLPPQSNAKSKTMIQRNEAIVDFISTAWEEIVRQKDTVIYDGH